VQNARFERLNDVARFGQRAGARVDEDAAAPDAIVVGLAHLRTEAADQIEMHAERQPMSFDERSFTQGRAADDMRAAHRIGEIGGGGDPEAAPIEPLREFHGLVVMAAPDQHIDDRPNARMRFDEM
jgi:hypothetical protein